MAKVWTSTHDLQGLFVRQLKCLLLIVLGLGTMVYCFSLGSSAVSSALAALVLLARVVGAILGLTYLSPYAEPGGLPCGAACLRILGKDFRGSM